ncbi:hypothetical protein [Aureibacter tunicatorum]|uniref:Lipoprotein n=1 Tax=Aureibacter tunicatorum TaxID=866807 RepID=A0AAE4BTD3_9BACT|nr:hypothetical protein [Aureibacter tunicatorum]MDR6242079.1 hypothetical protein [Aureibacter tunicatorum]BDD07551.1 hypothetical protein AUTU_50340 [Aureibacter tunicatorum]
MKKALTFFFASIISFSFLSCSNDLEQDMDIINTQSNNISYKLVSNGMKHIIYPTKSNDVQESKESHDFINMLDGLNIYPHGIEINDKGLDFESSLWGQKYTVSSKSSRSMGGAEIILSGIKYKGGLYKSNDIVRPIYNGNRIEDIPSGEYYLLDMAGNQIAELDNGVIPVESIISDGLFGKFQIKYQLEDPSKGIWLYTQINIILIEDRNSSRAMGDNGDDDIIVDYKP